MHHRVDERRSGCARPAGHAVGGSTRARVAVVRASVVGVLAIIVAGCHGPTPRAEMPVPHPVPVRFMLTFDDGPSGRTKANPTAAILDQLADNPVQPGIKAIFFVQTRNHNGGASEYGRALLQRVNAEGHVLALHSGSSRGHVNHLQMPLAELETDLEQGIDDIRRIRGTAPRFIRPPFWASNSETVARYRAHNLSMLLDDVSIGDGKVRGISSNPRVRQRMRADLRKAHSDITNGRWPAVAGEVPVIVTFHDTNPTTARGLQAYLRILLEEARHCGLIPAAKPFFDSDLDIERVAGVRSGLAAYAKAPLTSRAPSPPH